MNIVKNSKGFTLIEIVIVIAIAALILAAVLIFVPQAQASQRDSQRRSAVGRALAKASECQSNNGGTVCPVAGNNGNNMGAYMTGIRPPGSATDFTVQAGALTCTGGSAGVSGVMRYQPDTPQVGSARISVCLEGSTQPYVQNN